MAEFLDAGDFEIEHCRLLTSEGSRFDLDVRSIAEIQIFEDIQSNSVAGYIALFDTVALAEIAPLIGQEYLELILTTPSLTDSADKINFKENVLHINKITTRTSIGNTGALTVLQFTTSEIIHNQRTRISRSMTGTCSDIVENILVNDLNCKKDLYIEKSVGVKKYIIPNIKPFSFIKNITPHAFSVENKSPSFVFFENRRGYHFRSIESLYSLGPAFTYSDGDSIPFPSMPKLTKEVMRSKLLNSMSRVIDYKIYESQDSLINSAVGAFNSHLIVHDITNKSHNTYDYNYFKDRKDEKHINYYNGGNDYPVFNDVVITSDGKTISDFSGVTFLSSTALKDDKDSHFTKSDSISNFDPVETENWLQRRRSILANIERSNVIEIQVFGNTWLAAGDIVNLFLTKRIAIHGNDTVDKFFKGAFLVKKLSHSFKMSTGKHTMLMELCKDSTSQTFENVTVHEEPKPINVGNRITQFYNRGGGIRR